MSASTPPLSRRLTDAFDAAREWLRGQVRKGTSVPYLAHPLVVDNLKDRLRHYLAETE